MSENKEDTWLEEMRALFDRGAGTVDWEELPIELWQYMVYECTGDMDDFTIDDFLSLILSGPVLRNALLLPKNKLDLAKAQSLCTVWYNVDHRNYHALSIGLDTGRYNVSELYEQLCDADTERKMVDEGIKKNRLKALVQKILATGEPPCYHGFALAIVMRDDELVHAHLEALDDGGDMRNLLGFAASENYVYGTKALLRHPCVTAVDINSDDGPGGEPLVVDAIDDEAWDVVLLLLSDTRLNLLIRDTCGVTPWEYVLTRFPPYSVLQAFAARDEIDITDAFGTVRPFELALMYGLAKVPDRVYAETLFSIETIFAISRLPLADKIMFMMDTVGPEIIKDYLHLVKPNLRITAHNPPLSMKQYVQLQEFFFHAVVREADRRMLVQKDEQACLE